MDVTTQQELQKKLEQVAQKLDPQAKLLSFWPLQGGISAQMTVLEFVGANGAGRKVIVRRPGAHALQMNPPAAVSEYRILQILQAVGVKVPTPYLLDTSGEIYAEPYLVIEYIDGDPLCTPADVFGAVRQMAVQLAALHNTATWQAGLAFLPKQADRLAKVLTKRPAVADDSMRAGEIRAALEAVWPLPHSGQEVLVHGDFWPGNLLWRDGELVAVIDWENAETGDALYDVAVTRLDILWTFGRDAMADFTHRYTEARGGDLDGLYRLLPYWDLLAALRPTSNLDEWASVWPELGRPDVTEASMRADHAWFVEQAFAQLAAANTR